MYTYIIFSDPVRMKNIFESYLIIITESWHKNISHLEFAVLQTEALF